MNVVGTTWWRSHLTQLGGKGQLGMCQKGNDTRSRSQNSKPSYTWSTFEKKWLFIIALQVQTISAVGWELLVLVTILETQGSRDVSRDSVNKHTERVLKTLEFLCQTQDLPAKQLWKDILPQSASVSSRCPLLCLILRVPWRCEEMSLVHTLWQLCHCRNESLLFSVLADAFLSASQVPGWA